MLTRLERVIEEQPGRPELAGPDHPMRAVTQQIAAGGGWDADRAAKVRDLFDGLAPDWNQRFSQERLEPVDDALARGGVRPGGWCAEVGSGTGMVTPLLATVFDGILSIDIAQEMLVRAPVEPGHRVRADGARLPLAEAAVAAVVLVNAFLFPLEVDRVLAPDGVVVWVNTLGDRTPIHLPPEQVVDALPGEWSGTTAAAGWGEWLVARRVTAGRPS